MKGNCILYKETKERYLWELQRKNELNNMISIPIGFISIMLGSLAYFFNNLPESSESWIYECFWVSLIFSCVGTVICVLFVFRHITGCDYAYVSDPKVLEDYEKKFIERQKLLNAEFVEEQIDAEIEDLIHDQQVEAVTINIKYNERKIALYRNLIIYIMLTIVGLVFSFCFRQGLDDKPSDVVKIQSELPLKINFEDSLLIKHGEPFKCDVKYEILDDCRCLHNSPKRKQNKNKEK